MTLMLSCLLAACATGGQREEEEAMQQERHTVCIQDAMQCPDGKWVGRSGPRCEFRCDAK